MAKQSKSKVELNIKGLERLLIRYRYNPPTMTYNLSEFINKFLVPVKDSFGDAIKINENHYQYTQVEDLDDALSENLSKVGCAYDDESDRGIVWVTEPDRVWSYMKSVFSQEHMGIIGFVDLESNIESFKKLKQEPDFIEFHNEIQSIIDYWSLYCYDENGNVKFPYYVIVGKNRGIYAIPTIYLKAVTENSLDIYDKKFQVDVKVYDEYMTKGWKTSIYRNEKNNFDDSEIMELIGYDAPMTKFVYDYVKEQKDVLWGWFGEKARVLYQDRFWILELYSAFHDKFGNKEWRVKQFEKSLKIHKDFKVVMDEFFKWYKELKDLQDVGELTRFKTHDGKGFRVVVFKLIQKIHSSKFQLNCTGLEFWNILADVKLDFTNKGDVYGFNGRGTSLLFGEMLHGLAGMTGFFKIDRTPFSDQYKFNKDKAKKSKDIESVAQYDVAVSLFTTTVMKRLLEEGFLIVPGKRGFDSADVNYVAKRDDNMVRINGEVYDKDDNVIRFSDIKPDDKWILEYGTDVDYVKLPFEKIHGDSINVDHIPPYVDNPSKRNLDECELTTERYNKWKNDRNAVYENEVLEAIQIRKEINV